MDLEMRMQDTEARIRVGDARLKLDARIAEEEIQKDKMVVQLEREQLYQETGSGGGNAKEVRNDI